jgi:hypothetical protein
VTVELGLLPLNCVDELRIGIMFASQQQAVVVWAVVVALFVIFSWSWLNSQREELHHRVDLLETHRTKLEGRLDDVLEKILMLNDVFEH